jgi:hypothetical protein
MDYSGKSGASIDSARPARFQGNGAWPENAGFGLGAGLVSVVLL